MSFDGIVERAEERQLDEDTRVLEDENSKLGEGANTSAHVSSRGYVLKTVAYDKAQAAIEGNGAESPHDHIERVRDVDRFPQAELEEIEGEGPFDHAWVRMDPSHMSHQQAAETYHIADVINEDLDMFFDLREEGITYDDFKPDNIHYFCDDELSDGNMDVAKPIDITDGSRKPWTEEEDLSYRRFADILDVYIQGTPNEDGLVDLYSISTPEAEEHVMNYLGLETTDITGDPYKDMFQAFDEAPDSLDDVLSY